MNYTSEQFEHWFARNHPLDWFGADLGGNAVPTKVRMQVWALCKAAWERKDVQDVLSISAGAANPTSEGQ